MAPDFTTGVHTLNLEMQGSDNEKLCPGPQSTLRRRCSWNAHTILIMEWGPQSRGPPSPCGLEISSISFAPGRLGIGWALRIILTLTRHCPDSPGGQKQEDGTRNRLQLPFCLQFLESKIDHLEILLDNNLEPCIWNEVAFISCWNQ